MIETLSQFRQDVRYALRSFALAPGLTAVIVLTLALGIGSTAAIFSVVDAVLLQPLPYPGSDRFVQIVENVPAEESFSGRAQRTAAMNQDEFTWWRERATTLSEIAITQPDARTLRTAEGTVRISAARVSPALFTMRGMAPLIGRGLVATDERADAQVVVLAESTWRRYYGADPSVLGTTMLLDGQAYAIVGVMPERFGDDALWTPFVVAPPEPGRLTIIQVTARLREGVPLEAAAAEIDTLGRQLRDVAAKPGDAPRFEVVRQRDQLAARVTPALRVLVIAVVGVLLIVCSNVANLLLVRGTRRHQELAIRRSLGATGGRLVRQMLAESFVLASFGALAGAGFAYGAVRVLKAAATFDLPARFQRSLGPTILPRLDEVAIDPTVLAFVAGLALATGLLFGVLPALKLARTGDGARRLGAATPAAVGNTRAGHALATVQLALAMMLLIGAGLLLQSFLKLAAVDAGFDPRGVLTFEVVIPRDYRSTQKLEVAEALTARVRALPQVASVGYTDTPPLQGGVMLGGGFVPQGMTADEIRAEQNSTPMNESTQLRYTSSDYLRALGARLVAGRWLDERDGPGSPSALLVSRRYAERYFPGRDAVGATIVSAMGNFTVAGVVDDLHLRGLDADPEKILFVAPRQTLPLELAIRRGPAPVADQIFLTTFEGSIAFAARTRGDPLAIVADVRVMLRDVDPRLAVDGVMRLDDVLSGLTTRPRFYAALVGAFGVIAGFIAVIGIYGVLAYVVGQRTKEIGLRMALGAERGAVLELVLRRGGVMIAAGIGAGLVGAAALTRYLEGMLFGLSALDATTYVSVTAVFAFAALLASYLPARRATAIDPIAALREE